MKQFLDKEPIQATGVIMAKTNSPETAFVISERNMINAFWDYMEKRVLI